RSRLPFLRLGVPTHSSETSVAAIASLVLVVARSRPSETVRRSRSSRPGSTIGLRAAFTVATLAAVTSPPTTSWPSAAADAADTLPTYPRPKTDTLIVLSLLAPSRGGSVALPTRKLDQRVLQFACHCRPVVLLENQRSSGGLEAAPAFEVADQ